MTATLIQKHPLKGTREFRLDGDEIHYAIQSVLKSESLSVVLCVLDPDPVVSGSMLAFVSRVNREPLVELFIDRPDKASFDAFVGTMRDRITEESFSRLHVTNRPVDVAGLRESIDMLLTYVDPEEIKPLLAAMHALADSPADRTCLIAVADAFNQLGFVQGQVITYAPYLNFLLSTASVDDSSQDQGPG